MNKSGGFESAFIKWKKKAGNAVDLSTGRADRMRAIYRSAFADGGDSEAIQKYKKQNRTFLFALLLVLAAVCALWAFEASARSDGGLDLMRGGPGSGTRRVDAAVNAAYGGTAAREDVTIGVLPKEASPEEAGRALEELSRRLPAEILGENASPDAVQHGLSLPDTDAVSGAEIHWESSDESVIGADGRVNPLGHTGEIVRLSAYLRLGEAWKDFSIALRIGPPPKGYDITAALRARIADAVKAASRSNAGDSLSLPAEAGDGVTLAWSAPGPKGHLPEVAIILLLLGVCFRLRYRALERRIAAARREIERDFPDFIGKLGLLLGAGLVITSAIDRIADDYITYRRASGKRQLYEELVFMRERMRAAGTALVYEFSDIARRSGSRELLRFSSILADNIDKGSALAEKLDQESGALWDSRKRRLEKDGRVAETKLIFPMVLQIFVIILVTVAPAAFEMH
ncbi:MAG: type II secretion system F family protein [Clostridiales bacterium]|nr:type II secretion system F family protein [Clostridiales bacterium]